MHFLEHLAIKYEKKTMQRVEKRKKCERRWVRAIRSEQIKFKPLIAIKVFTFNQILRTEWMDMKIDRTSKKGQKLQHLEFYDQIDMH